jgi:outer membrane protein OmpA-like peptidoglycan-associated protein
MNKLWGLLLLLTTVINTAAQQTHIDYSYYDTVQFSVGNEIRFPTFVYDCCDGRCPHYSIYDSIAKLINKHPQIVFQVESHTDCRAGAEYNRSLSQRRADTARAELLRLINDTTQLPRAVGMGEDDLFIKKCQCDLSDYKRNCTEAEHQLNRRSLLRVIAIKDSSLLPRKR